MKRIAIVAVLAAVLMSGCGCGYNKAFIDTHERVLEVDVDHVDINDDRITVTTPNGDIFESGAENIILVKAREQDEKNCLRYQKMCAVRKRI